jgi:3-dehydroquinate dehydratase
MVGYFRGFWYAQVIESTRGLGRVVLSMHSFETQVKMEQFINEYNKILLEDDGVPDVYKMAESCSEWDVTEYIRKSSRLR